MSNFWGWILVCTLWFTFLWIFKIISNDYSLKSKRSQVSSVSSASCTLVSILADLWFEWYWFCQRFPVSQDFFQPSLRCFKSIKYYYCWRNGDELISDVLLWTPTYGRAKAGWPARTYTQQLCEDTGCSPEELPEVMNDREEVAREGQGYPCWRHDMMMMMMLFEVFSLEFEWQQVSSSLQDSS